VVLAQPASISAAVGAAIQRRAWKRKRDNRDRGKLTEHSPMGAY